MTKHLQACPDCGATEHLPIVEDEDHCDCEGGYRTEPGPWPRLIYPCECPCHGPEWAL
jgi:hypothetical protein